MYKNEKLLLNQLLKLKDKYNILGIKAEFEAEGSSFRDLVRLRRITNIAGVKLFLKIGGVEAVRDFKDAIELGVDGVIAPMVETKFASEKFFEMYQKIYGSNDLRSTLNIESKVGIENLDEIIQNAKDKCYSINIGRTDLSTSFLDKKIKPDDDFIFRILEAACEKITLAGIKFTIGGSISTNTISVLNESYPDILNKTESLETRKVIIPTDAFINGNAEVLKESLIWEKIYILSKKDFSDLSINAEISRLTELEKRAR